MNLGTKFERPFVCVVFRKKEEVRNSEEWLYLAEKKKLYQQRVYNSTRGSNVDGERRKKASRKEKDR